MAKRSSKKDKTATVEHAFGDDFGPLTSEFDDFSPDLDEFEHDLEPMRFDLDQGDVDPPKKPPKKKRSKAKKTEPKKMPTEPPFHILRLTPNPGKKTSRYAVIDTWTKKVPPTPIQLRDSFGPGSYQIQDALGSCQKWVVDDFRAQDDDTELESELAPTVSPAPPRIAPGYPPAHEQSPPPPRYASEPYRRNQSAPEHGGGTFRPIRPRDLLSQIRR